MNSVNSEIPADCGGESCLSDLWPRMKAAAPNLVMEEATEEIKMADGVLTDKSKVHFPRSE